MNQYGLPLSSPSIQTMLPAMDKAGRVYGFYPITKTTFTGAETSFTLSDTVVPITTVTLDKDPTGHSHVFTQYMAAVWPADLDPKYQPWSGSASFISNSQGAYTNWSMTTQMGARNYANPGLLVTGLKSGLNRTVSVPAAPAGPTDVTPVTLIWEASASYASLNGNTSFFDFNWITIFNTTSANKNPLRIVVTSSASPFKATIVATPTEGSKGPVFDTVRILKLGDPTPGSYAFNFTIFDDQGLSTNAVLNLTIN